MRRRTGKRKRFFIVLGVAVGAVLLYTLFSEGGLLHVVRQRAELGRIRERNATVQAENAQRERRAEALRSDLAMIERIAREELGMVRGDELVYQFKPPRASTRESTRESK